MHSHGPNLVPPFQSISLNLTTTAESLLQYQADPIFDFKVASLKAVWRKTCKEKDMEAW